MNYHCLRKEGKKDGRERGREEGRNDGRQGRTEETANLEVPIFRYANI